MTKQSKILLIVLFSVVIISTSILLVIKMPKKNISGKTTKGGLNNPGNIRNTGIKWGGEITKEGEIFESFDTIENGIKAMYANLMAYANKYNLRTIRGIIGRWAPNSDGNNETAYIKAVSAKTGLSPDETLSIFDYPAVIAAMSVVEGTFPVTKDQVSNALNIT